MARNLDGSPTGDIELVDDLAFVDDDDDVQQGIEMALGTWLNESVYDRAQGVPYLQIIFKRGTPLASVRAIIAEQVRAVRGVADVLEVKSDFDREARTLTLAGRARTHGGRTVPFSVTQGVP